MIPEDAGGIESLTEVIRKVGEEQDAVMAGPEVLAEAILGEWSLIFNYERVVRAAQALAASIRLDGQPAHKFMHELAVALRPFED